MCVAHGPPHGTKNMTHMYTKAVGNYVTFSFSLLPSLFLSLPSSPSLVHCSTSASGRPRIYKGGSWYVHGSWGRGILSGACKCGDIMDWNSYLYFRHFTMWATVCYMLHMYMYMYLTEHHTLGVPSEAQKCMSMCNLMEVKFSHSHLLALRCSKGLK